MKGNKRSKRIIAIGDIHGHFKKLEALLKRLPIYKNDVLVFLGDYIDRGAGSKQVISKLIEVKKKYKNTVFLMGNHEHLLLEFRRTGDPDLIPYLRQQGIESTLESYGENDLSRLHDLSFMPKDHVNFLDRLMLYYQEDEYVFVHAGLIPGKPLMEHTPDELCEVRDTFLENEVEVKQTVVFGHTPFELPLVTKRKIGIDTGAIYGNLLTALILPEKRFFHA